MFISKALNPSALIEFSTDDGLVVCSTMSLLSCLHFNKLCGICVSPETGVVLFLQGKDSFNSTEYNLLNCKSSFCPGDHLKLTYPVIFCFLNRSGFTVPTMPVVISLFTEMNPSSQITSTQD